MAKNIIIFLGFLCFISLITACAPSGYTMHRYGFFGGFWHGLLFLPDFIGKILGFGTGIYADNNTGFSYWAGYFLGFFWLGFGSRFLK